MNPELKDITGNCLQTPQGAHTFLKTDLRPFMTNLRPHFDKFKTYRQCADIKVRIWKWVNKIISSESLLNLTFFNRSISALIKFKTFLRPLSQKCQNLRPF